MDLSTDVGMDVDVIVVGAGVGGLAAAQTLADDGYAVAVLEGRERVGGRLLVETYGEGGRVDLGATWIWPGEQRVERLVEVLDVAIFPQHLAGDAVFHQPAPDGAVGTDGTPRGTAARIDGNPLDVPSWRFVDGAAALTEALAHSLADGVVRLGQTVRAIRSVKAQGKADGSNNDGGVVVETDTARLRAAHVIVAIPPALAAASIEFDPPLPERLAGLAAVTPVWMGSTIKVVARYETPFWRESGLSGSGISHIGPIRELHDISGPSGNPAALFGFVPGLTADDPAPTEASVVKQLAEMFGPEAQSPVEVFIRDWRREPLTSPEGVERLNAYQTYGHQLYQGPAMNGRLHWSSTETSTVNPGHIEGALAAAERSVAAIAAVNKNRKVADL